MFHGFVFLFFHYRFNPWMCSIVATFHTLTFYRLNGDKSEAASKRIMRPDSFFSLKQSLKQLTERRRASEKRFPFHLSFWSFVCMCQLTTEALIFHLHTICSHIREYIEQFCSGFFSFCCSLLPLRPWRFWFRFVRFYVDFYAYFLFLHNLYTHTFWCVSYIKRFHLVYRASPRIKLCQCLWYI